MPPRRSPAPRPARRATTRRLVGAVVATVAGLVVLLGAPGSQASLTDEASTAVVEIRGGNLGASLTQAGPTTVSTGTSTVVSVPTGATGLVPGVQAQRWTYGITSPGTGAGASTVPARASFRLRTTSVTEPYPAVRPHLVIAWSATGAASGSGTVPRAAITATGIDHTFDLPGTIRPGQTISVTLTFSLPAVDASGNQLARSLDLARSTTINARTMLTMADVVTLHQVPRTS